MATILLVEDDDQLRTMLNVLLTHSGYEVYEARNGTGVCDMHQTQRFDLIITDLVMSDIEGLELIMDLRRIDQKVPIIAMSGAEQAGIQNYLKIAQRLGARLTLSKPFDNQEFLDTVSRALETRG